MRFKFLLAFLIIPLLGQATELAPWFGRDKEFEWRTSYDYQWYRHVARWSSSKRKPSYDQFITTGLSISPSPDWNGEFEGTLANTSVQNWNIDNLRLTGRYRLMDDVIGDIVSLVLGATVDTTTKKSRKDVSSFHHGNYEAELHAAVGKEFSKGQFWTSRIWGLLGIGAANKGSPWVHALAAYDRNHGDCFGWRIYANSLWGWGSQNITFPFHGYGPIHHQSIDLGLRGNYLLDCQALCHVNLVGTLSLEVAYRVFARNCPAHAARATFIAMFPFWL